MIFALCSNYRTRVVVNNNNKYGDFLEPLRLCHVENILLVECLEVTAVNLAPNKCEKSF